MAKKQQVTNPEIQQQIAKTYTVVLRGCKGSQFHGAVNGETFVYPCGVELEIPEHIYAALKEHIV